jgi:hypothetical protein
MALLTAVTIPDSVEQNMSYLALIRVAMNQPDAGKNK